MGRPRKGVKKNSKRKKETEDDYVEYLGPVEKNHDKEDSNEKPSQDEDQILQKQSQDEEERIEKQIEEEERMEKQSQDEKERKEKQSQEEEDGIERQSQSEKEQNDHDLEEPEGDIVMTMEHEHMEQPKRKKQRGPTRMKNIARDPNSREKVEFTDMGEAIGPGSVKLSSYLGPLVREHISVTIDDWRKISEELKTVLWRSVQLFTFTVPYVDIT